jgi:hypothetical protein
MYSLRLRVTLLTKDTKELALAYHIHIPSRLVYYGVIVTDEYKTLVGFSC